MFQTRRFPNCSVKNAELVVSEIALTLAVKESSGKTLVFAFFRRQLIKKLASAAV